MFAAAGIPSISKFSVKASGHSGIPSLLFPATSSLLFPASSQLLREFAGKNWILPAGGRCRGEARAGIRFLSRDHQRDVVLSLAGDSLPIFGQMWLSTTGPLLSVTVLFAELCPTTGRQECLRAIAQSRRDEDRVHVLVLPRSSALRSPPPSLLPIGRPPPLWGSGIFEEFPNHLSLDSFGSAMCVDAPDSMDERSLFWICRKKGCWHLPRLRQESRMYLFPSFFLSLWTSFANSHFVSAGASIQFQCFVLRSFLEFFGAHGTPEVIHFCMTPCHGPHSFPNFCVTHRGLRELDCVIWSQLSNFLQNGLVLWALSWDTQPFWIFFLSVMPLILFPATFLWLFTGAAHQPRVCLKWQRSRIRIQTCDSGTRERAHKSHDGSAHFPFRKSLHGLLPFNPEGLCSSWTAILIRLPSVSLGRRFQRRRGWMCSFDPEWDPRPRSRRFPEASPWVKLQESPLGRCPFAFHWKHSPHYSFRADVSSSTTLWPVPPPSQIFPIRALKLRVLIVWSICCLTHRPQVFDGSALLHIDSALDCTKLNSVSGSWSALCNFMFLTNLSGHGHEVIHLFLIEHGPILCRNLERRHSVSKKTKHRSDRSWAASEAPVAWKWS